MVLVAKKSPFKKSMEDDRKQHLSVILHHPVHMAIVDPTYMHDL